jgi:hypothetical protein
MKIEELIAQLVEIQRTLPGVEVKVEEWDYHYNESHFKRLSAVVIPSEARPFVWVRPTRFL